MLTNVRSAPQEPNQIPPLSLYRGDPLFDWLLNRWRLRYTHIILLTMVCGFGMLSLLYLWMLAWHPEIRQLRGLFEFYSATIGDVLVLPWLNCLAIGYCHYIAQKLPKAAAHALQSPAATNDFLRRADRLYNRPLATVLLLVTVISLSVGWHLGELYGPDRNWTLPVRGRINIAGVYHQLFWGLELYIMLFLLYRHGVTVRLLMQLANTHFPAALASVAEDILKYFSGILVIWNLFCTLFLADFFYNAAEISFVGLFSQPVALVVLLSQYTLLFLLGILPAIIIFRKLNRRLTTCALPLLLIASSLVLFVGPILYLLWYHQAKMILLL